MNTERTRLRLLAISFVAAAGFTAACSSSPDANESATTPTSATETSAAAATPGDAAAAPAETTEPAATLVDDAGAPATAPAVDASADAAPANCNDSVRAGSNICTAVLDGGAAPNGCLDNGGCYDFMYNLTPNVFAEAATCVGNIKSCQAGDPGIMTCLTTALSGACLDPSTASYCARIDSAEAACTQGTPADAGSMQNCQQLLSGMTTAGRESFVKCASESCADPQVVPDCLTFVMSEAMD